MVSNYVTFVLIERFKELVNIVNWNNTYIDEDDVEEYIRNGGIEQTENYSEGISGRTDEWHKGRVMYFINRPEEICDLKVTETMAEFLEVDDGNHRLIASLLLYKWGKMDRIHINFTGSKGTLDYLLVRGELKG